eukprot:Gb_36413 [translate_table: standard]
MHHLVPVWGGFGPCGKTARGWHAHHPRGMHGMATGTANEWLPVAYIDYSLKLLDMRATTTRSWTWSTVLKIQWQRSPCCRLWPLPAPLAILRIPDNDPVMAKKAMDLDPQGLMFPIIDEPKAAMKAVSYCLYPPKGIRGAWHSAVRASQYGINGKYLETYEDELLIMFQVESEEAVKRIDDIASVDGVDCIQMGPTDMSASMGYLSNPGHKKAKEMLKRAEKNIGLLRNAALEDVRKYKGSALGSVGIISPSEILDGDESGESEKEIEKEYA